jgi:3-oxoacyl-[acyl-carrier-protein] synthase II
MREVVITGIGLVTPLGHVLAEFGRGLFGGGAAFGAGAMRVPGARVQVDVAAELCRSETLVTDRNAQLGLIASSRALTDAALPAGSPAFAGCGVYVGNGSGPAESLDAAYTALHGGKRMPGLTLLRCLPSGAASSIAIRHGLRGPAQTYNSACASASVAIGEAMRAIRHGYLDIALAGGTETPFGDATVRAWEALRVLAPEGDDAGAACRPFDRSRRGLVLGEGAVFFVLEAAEHAAGRRATVQARLAGYASGGDAHHWTEPSARGQVEAMRAALADAGLAAADIGCINAHGTGTPVGDQIEAESIATVFGTGSAGPLVSSTKATHGHLLGASGAIELAASIVSLRRGMVPPTRNLRHPDERCALNLVRDKPALLPPGRAVLSNSFAFGGSNACLVVS